MSTKHSPTLCLVAGVFLVIPLLQAADEKSSGKDLHDFNCTSCHSSDMYTRENRKMNSVTSLRTQVQRCETTLSLGWFDEELDLVTDYLNKSYYQFK